MKHTLGVCYYPEHWPRELWETDAKYMFETGLTWVRIGEFSWSRLEPQPRQYNFDWLDDAIDVLGRTGLKIVLGTPTATPPRWMLDKHPDMLALDIEGQPRKFGSRRHYCFSHEGYKAECVKIVTKLAERYGRNAHVAAWQTDNEYGCHDTTISYSQAAQWAFRDWLRDRYPGYGNDGDIAALNSAWGNVFWSMEYENFDQIALPHRTVTEPNPAHVFAFRRFSSDQVVAFNKLQVDIIRTHSRAPITHNYMGRTTDFDHFKVGADLDIASWDSYPLGFLEDRITADTAHRRCFARQGDPDFQAFHHDLYRAVGRGRWWVMEQQSGPVNWASHNPEPHPGMVRLWTWEAFAHGAEAVCYFRWRQMPKAQEQMHSGLLRPDSIETPAMAEVRQVAVEIAETREVSQPQAHVGLIFDYNAAAAWAIQPHGEELSYFGLVFDVYRAMRSLGLSIDILSPNIRDFAGYRLIVAPGIMHVPEDLKQALVACNAQVLIGPRTAAKDEDMSIPLPLPPNLPGLDVTVARVESFRLDMPIPLEGGGQIQGYREVLESSATILTRTTSGEMVVVKNDKGLYYVGSWLDSEGWKNLLRIICTDAEIPTIDLPRGVRVRDGADDRFWFNFNKSTCEVQGMSLAPISVTRQKLST